MKNIAPVDSDPYACKVGHGLNNMFSFLQLQLIFAENVQCVVIWFEEMRCGQQFVRACGGYGDSGGICDNVGAVSYDLMLGLLNVYLNNR